MTEDMVSRIRNVVSPRIVGKTLTIISAVFFVVLAYFFVFAGLMPRYEQFNNTMLLDTGLALLLIIGLVRASRLRLIDTVANRVQQKRILIPLFTATFFINLIIAYALAIDPSQSGWDPLTIFQSTLNLVMPHKLFADVAGYFQFFPNNLGVVGLLAAWLNLWSHLGVHNYIALTLVLNVILLNTSLVFLYLCARELTSPKGSLLALILGVLFITLFPWSRTYYSDTVGLFFTTTSLYLILRLRRAPTTRMRFTLALLLGISAGIGYSMKPTTSFVIIAAGLVYGMQKLPVLFQRSDKRHARIVLTTLAIVVVSLAVSSWTIKAAMTSRMRLTINTMPLSNFALIGLSKVCTADECRYGAWNMQDALKQGTFATLKDYQLYTHTEIKHRLETYGVGGYLFFMSQKGAWILGDGTFYTYYEGLERTAPLLHGDHVSRIIQSVLHPSGHYYKWYINAIQTCWITILLCIAAPFFMLKKRHFKNELHVLFISLLGLIVFLVFFEARSRYLYLYVSFFILAAASGYESITREVRTILGRLLR